MTNVQLTTAQERRLIGLVGLVQFINVLDFMMVMPLGPDFARALNIPLSHIGYVGGSYTLMAAIAGFLGALYLDRFPRKTAMLYALAGLVVATVSAAFAQNATHMILSRMAAGLFGGPLSAIGLALVIDVIPPARRGVAIGKVMGAFAVASVLGVPFGLELASRLGWQAPFLSFGVMGLLIFALVWFGLQTPPRVVQSVSVSERWASLRQLLTGRLNLATFGLTALGILGGFMIIPNIAAHLQFNLGYPRSGLGVLYLCGGLVSFFGMRLTGKLVDKTSSTFGALIFTVTLSVAIVLGFMWWGHSIPVIVIFTLFMLSMSARNVCAQTLASKVPPPQMRAGFMSLNTAATHLSCAVGAGASSLILTEQDGRLLHMPVIAAIAIALYAVGLVLFAYVERHLTRQQQAAPVAIPPVEMV